MEEKQLEQLVRQILEKIITEQAGKKSSSNKEELAIIETPQYPFSKLEEATRNALKEKYQCQLLTIDKANQLKPKKSLLLNLSLQAQAKAALGIADCSESIFLQMAFITGRRVEVLVDCIVDLNEIASFEYKKLFIQYQRRLKEFGVHFVTQESLKNIKKEKTILVEKDIQHLKNNSTLCIPKGHLLSYGAKQLIKEKQIILIRE